MKSMFVDLVVLNKSPQISFGFTKPKVRMKTKKREWRITPPNLLELLVALNRMDLWQKTPPPKTQLLQKRKKRFCMCKLQLLVFLFLSVCVCGPNGPKCRQLDDRLCACVCVCEVNKRTRVRLAGDMLARVGCV